VVVSIAVVFLRPIQLENRRAEQEAELAAILARQPALGSLLGDTGVTAVEQQVVNLGTGELVEDVRAAEFDALAASRDPATSLAIPADRDVAEIERRARYGVITTVRRDGDLAMVVVPIYGRGYASMLRGSIALEADGNTVAGLVISEHGETPGIGSEITDSAWLETWSGKKLRDERGQWALSVVTEETEADGKDSPFRVDGISGASRSSEGVGNMVRYWLGDGAYGPFLARLRTGELR
jgi:Na+-transporting NADH:ubiquinone oxidoreductase subunit C